MDTETEEKPVEIEVENPEEKTEEKTEEKAEENAVEKAEEKAVEKTEEKTVEKAEEKTVEKKEEKTKEKTKEKKGAKKEAKTEVIPEVVKVIKRKPILRLRKNKTSSLVDFATEELEKLLECPVCHEILVPPIFSCEAGHVICSQCDKTNFTECALCDKPFTEAQNLPLEAILEAAKFYCNHRHKGCEVTSSIQERKEHLEVCPFRGLKCHMTGSNRCTGPILYMSDYVDHLKTFHKLETIKPMKFQSNIFTEKYEIEDWEGATVKTKKANSWDESLFNYDGNVFMSRAFIRGQTFYSRFYLIDEQEAAHKYAVKITVQKVSGDPIPNYELSKRVPTIREIPEDPKTLRSFVSLHRDLMESVGNFFPAGEDNSKSRLEWMVKYEILSG